MIVLVDINEPSVIIRKDFESNVQANSFADDCESDDEIIRMPLGHLEQQRPYPPGRTPNYTACPAGDF